MYQSPATVMLLIMIQNQLTSSPDRDQLHLWPKHRYPHLSNSVVRQTIDFELTFQTIMTNIFHDKNHHLCMSFSKFRS